MGTGVDGIDLARARECGVTVSNTPAAFCDPVADTVMGYVLLFARRLDRMSEMVRVGRWERLPLLSLRECTLGIVGLGAIGRAVATRAAAFAMTAYGYDVHMPGERELADLRIVGRPLDALLSESDFITLHADLRPDNRHLIDERRLALMRPTAVLINTARGGLIDETALVAALRDGRLAGAALDVFEREPLPSRSPLRSLPNVYLSPHNANASVAAAERVHASTIQNLLAGLSAATR